MIPIRDNIRSRHFPWMTVAIILANAAMFWHELELRDGLGDFVMRYGLVPWKLTEGIRTTGFVPSAHLVPWFSSMFIHGGWLHIIGNMWFLWIFGDNVEDRFGPWKFLVFYILGGLVAGAFQVAVGPMSKVPMIGASGAISAVLAAYVLFYPKARVVTLVPLFILFFFIELPAILFIGFWFVLQYLNGMSALSSGVGEGVAWWAHIGGFIGGVVLALLFKGEARPAERRKPPGHVTVMRRRRY